MNWLPSFVLSIIIFMVLGHTDWAIGVVILYALAAFVVIAAMERGYLR